MVTSNSALPVAGESVPFDEALLITLGYCLGVEPVRWTSPAGGVGDRPVDPVRGAFAYRTYDGVPAAAGSRIEPIDVLVADGLNAQMRARDIAGVLAVADELAAEIERIDAEGTCFWELDRAEVVTEPGPKDAAWPVWRSWTMLRGGAGIDLARSHKILHHKRPRVFPLIDNKTVEYLRSGSAVWGSIHDDLITAADAWSCLEGELAERVRSTRLPTPERLRLHDILLWTRATGRREAARDHGARSERDS